MSLCSALEQKGISEVWEMIASYEKLAKENNFFHHKRRQQNRFWLLQTIDEHLKGRFYNRPEIKSALQEQLRAVENNETTPFAAARLLLNYE